MPLLGSRFLDDNDPHRAPPPKTHEREQLVPGLLRPELRDQVGAIGDVPDVEHHRARFARDDAELAFDTQDVVEHHSDASAEQGGVALRTVRASISGTPSSFVSLKIVNAGSTADFDVGVRE